MSIARTVRGATLLAFVWVAPLSYGETPKVAFVAGFDRFARHGQIDPVLGGRLLLTELSCTACHASNDSLLKPIAGPRLDGIADRLQTVWLKEFLASPHQTKPGTRMPDVLASMPESERSSTIDALVAFLGTQHKPFPEFKAGGANPLPHQFWLKGNVDRGRELYHLVGCVACHAPDPEHKGGGARPSTMARLLETLDPEEIEELGLSAAVQPFGSVPHADLSKKYNYRSLVAFLVDPEAVRPSGRMPNLKLSPVEAADIAAYLLRDTPPQPDDKQPDDKHPGDESPRVDEALVHQGRQLFSSLSCANCHALDAAPPTTSAPPIEKLDPRAEPSCLGPVASALPSFALDDPQVEAIVAALTDLKNREVTKLQTAHLDFTLLQQNCYACHQRGGLGGVGPERESYFETVGHVDLGDEGRLPPPLDHVGQKLRREWLSKVFAGTGDIRPHMQARMPHFPKAAVAHLPQALIAADHPQPLDEFEVFPDQEGLVEAGRMLLDTGCVQCHPLRGESLMGAVGVDLLGVTRRVQPGWFREFLRNPMALKNRTRMPTFFPDGQSTNPDVLEGDVDDQITAIWAYLKNLETARLPNKIEEARSQQFELLPVQRPILLRTFMQKAGPHAIAVGFPAGLHYAFDAERLRIAEVWRGRFLDAYGTWFVRSAPPAEPLGTDIVEMPPGFPFAVFSDANTAWPTSSAGSPNTQFSGYRIDPQGIPTLLYRFGGYEIEDQIEATKENGLRRRLTVRHAGPTEPDGQLWFRAHAAEELVLKGAACTDPDGVTVALSAPAADAVLHRSNADSKLTEWRVLVHDGQTLEVTYQW